MLSRQDLMQIKTNELNYQGNWPTQDHKIPLLSSNAKADFSLTADLSQNWIPKTINSSNKFKWLKYNISEH
jgi:hypothetical protein